VALTQTQLVSAVADGAELSKNDAKRALAALEDVVLEEIANAQKVRIGGLGAAHRPHQAGDEEAPGSQPRDRRADHDRCQAGERRSARAPAGQGEGVAAVCAEGSPPARDLTDRPTGRSGTRDRPQARSSTRSSHTRPATRVATDDPHRSPAAIRHRRQHTNLLVHVVPGTYRQSR
jgi:hypothetical protein